MIKTIAYLLSFLAFLMAAGCAKPPAAGLAPASRQDIAELTQSINALGTNVDPDEARRAAQIAYEYPLQLAKEYRITDHPLIHNVKVNRGTRPRGLCWQWADDLQIRLLQENFQTLALHRAIANSDNPILIEHSTVIISSLGGDQNQGIVLDPWRYGGALFWSPTLSDPKYKWIPRAEVFAKKRQRAKRRLAGAS